MTRNTKILLGITGGLLLLCMCASVTVLLGTGFFISRAATTQPSSVEFSSSAIADFDLPEGFMTDYAINALGFRVVGYKSVSGNAHLVLAEAPAGFSIDAEKLHEEIQGIVRREGYNWNFDKMHLVEERTVTVRGQTTTLQISEGEGGNGPFRQASVAFAGESGPAWVLFSAPVREWDEALLDAFLASIR